jgi:glycosyltransferase involved in cell wall biosynthesis
MRRLPRLANVPPLGDADCPSISVILAARDEAAKLPGAIQTLLAQDYPHYEVIAVNDRSQDATGQILEQFALTNRHLRVIHVGELPASWLGKPHALWRGYQQSQGERLVFTDADVHFARDLLRRAASLARAQNWDHVTLFGSLELDGFWEKVGTTYFGVGFIFGVEPWRVHDPRSRRYMGAGYFQLLRRSTYEAIGAHKRLAMEVVDDMKLGKLVKLGGFLSGVAVADEHVRLRWHRGLGEMIQGVTKNFFAASNFSILRVFRDVASVLCISVMPFVLFPFSRGLVRLFSAMAAILALAVHTQCARNYHLAPQYGLTHPLGAAIFCYMLLRSMVVTLWRGGIVWRDTFYPLEELKRGLV